jgi:hypothetical protein
MMMMMMMMMLMMMTLAMLRNTMHLQCRITSFLMMEAVGSIYEIIRTPNHEAQNTEDFN